MAKATRPHSLPPSTYSGLAGLRQDPGRTSESPAESFQGTPTAWDHAFRDRRPCFVRARLKEGSWVGGWYGSRSYASSYPQPAELLLESARLMNPDGSFGGRVNQSAGLYLRANDFDVLEFVDPPEIREMS